MDKALLSQLTLGKADSVVIWTSLIWSLLLFEVGLCRPPHTERGDSVCPDQLKVRDPASTVTSREGKWLSSGEQSGLEIKSPSDSGCMAYMQSWRGEAHRGKKDGIIWGRSWGSVTPPRQSWGLHVSRVFPKPLVTAVKHQDRHFCHFCDFLSVIS